MTSPQKPTISVIIPTYKRKQSVLRLLNSLRGQTLPVDCYEVLVVDDGSPDDTGQIANEQFPFQFTYIRQENQGATIARNHGVDQSKGNILVFIDDDVTVSPGTLQAFVDAFETYSDVIIMGQLIHRNEGKDSIYARIQLAELSAHGNATANSFLSFAECNTELLAVRRNDFFAIGRLQDPTSGRGWPNWDDVDFGYRAHLHGYQLLQAAGAVGEHWDYSLGDWQTACKRWQRASKSAVLLFRAHPGLRPHIPMLHDKTPIVPGEDSPGMVLRKTGRALFSSPPIMFVLEKSVKIIEKRLPNPRLLGPLYRWIAGGYMYRGYHDGLRDYANGRTPA